MHKSVQDHTNANVLTILVHYCYSNLQATGISPQVLKHHISQMASQMCSKAQAKASMDCEGSAKSGG